MKKFSNLFAVFFFILLSLVVARIAFADSTKECREILERSFPKLQIDRVRPGPVPGLCEIWSGTNVFYFNPEKKLLFFGEIWTSDGKSLTKESQNLLIAEHIRNLDLSRALKWGNGKTKVILVVDPDCPYCKVVEKVLLSPAYSSTITAYIFLYPLKIHPKAEEHSIAVLCSEKPVETLVAGNFSEIKVTDSCRKSALQRLKAMKEEVTKLGVKGTPFIAVEDRIIRGANLEEIFRAIAEKSEQKSASGKAS